MTHRIESTDGYTFEFNVKVGFFFYLNGFQLIVANGNMQCMRAAFDIAK